MLCETKLGEGIHNVEKQYDKAKGKWDSGENGVPFMINSLPVLQECFAKALESVEVSSQESAALDLGCGSGYWSQAMKDRDIFSDIHGIDISEDILVKARSLVNLSMQPNLHKLEPSDSMESIHFRQGDARMTGYPACNFDFLVAYGDVVSHMTDQIELTNLFLEIDRITKKHSVILLEVDHKWSLSLFWHWQELKDALFSCPWNKGHSTRAWEGMRFKTFTRTELILIAEKFGWKVLSLRGHNILSALMPDSVLFGSNQGVLAFVTRLLGKIDQVIMQKWDISFLSTHLIATFKKL